ncbi:MAG: 30S ribosomal protein S24e [Pyrobaculum sp.]
MSLEILNTSIRENRLLGRKEVVLELAHPNSPTPTRHAIRELVARQLGVDIDKVVVRKIETGYGVERTKAEIHVYQDPQRARAIEPLYMLARNGEEWKKEFEARRAKKKERKKK